MFFVTASSSPDGFPNSCHAVCKYNIDSTLIPGHKPNHRYNIYGRQKSSRRMEEPPGTSVLRELLPESFEIPASDWLWNSQSVTGNSKTGGTGQWKPEVKLKSQEGKTVLF